MEIFFLIIFSFLFFILTIRRIDLALMLIVFLLPSYLIRFNIFGFPFTLLEVMVLIAFFSWFIFKTEFKNFLKGKCSLENFKKNRLKRIKYPFGLEITLLLIISFISVAIAGFGNDSFGIFKAYFFEPILFFILILNVFKKDFSSKKIDKILWPLVLSSFFISIFAFYQKITGDFIFNEFWANENSRRITSFFNYPNAVGLYLAPIIIFLFGWLVKKIKEKKYKIKFNDFNFLKILFIFLTIVLSCFSVFFAKSEGALAGLFFSFFFFMLFFGKRIRFLIISFMIIFLAFIFLNQPVKDCVLKKIELKDLSGEIRKQQWRETWNMLKDGRMISGAGLSSYQKEILPYHQEGIFFNKDNDPDFKRKIVIFDEKYKEKYWQPVEIYMYPHNIFLNFWSELGIAGMFLFILIMGKFFYYGFALIKKESVKLENKKYLIVGLFCSMIVILVHGLVDVPYFKNDLSILFWILIGVMSLFKIESFSENLKKDK